MSKYLPDWLKRPTPSIGKSLSVNKILKQLNLNTVCQSAKCPNLLECFSGGTATFLILGNKCTRHCRFCAIPSSNESAMSAEQMAKEPAEITQAVIKLNLKHIVITSVTRDDLVDGGSGYFAKAVRSIRNNCSSVTIEVLTPDFNGNTNAVKTVANARPDVFNHNLETVPSLYQSIRPKANYQLSLDLIRFVKDNYPGIITKSGLMVGLGEKKEDVLPVLKNLVKYGCDVVTIGQYLKPVASADTIPVQRFIPPEEFEQYRKNAMELGFKGVSAGPFVRSSYNAYEFVQS
ncbi:MAG: lipoyl synthase [Candidatus Brocadiia bacterium]